MPDFNLPYRSQGYATEWDGETKHKVLREAYEDTVIKCSYIYYYF